MGELTFLIPYKMILVHQYGTSIFLFLVVLFANLFAAASVKSAQARATAICSDERLKPTMFYHVRVPSSLTKCKSAANDR